MAKNIRRDLEIGKEAEELVRTRLNEKFGLQLEFNKDYRNIHCDLICSKTGLTFEVKFDKYAARSGRLAIESYNTKTNKPSGITLTTAKYWVHVLDRPSVILISTTQKLRSFLDEVKAFKIVEKAGDGNSRLHLYEKERIIGPLFIDIEEMGDFLAI